ncbi:hypothetical protein Bca52824_036767 [Brassica carinata]|uniref:Uncharacterized protein n=1 Tax=Brassica carinata TaxID=52824 RepID=A0A8X7S7S6_BRACI|nr:hypothetical protein Bca52824_036767 [Brassica carinata]
MAFPSCVQCGTRQNPCRCKVVGPTLGFVAFLVTGIIEWPVGAVVYIFKHGKGRRIMGHPATVMKAMLTTICQQIHIQNEASDKYVDNLFEKLAVEKALKKLNKGPDGRYTNVWEVVSDADFLIGAFGNIIFGPEYEEIRKGGPKRLNMQFFKDIQTRMRDPNFKFTPEIKLKPTSKLVPRKKWQKAQSRRRKAQKR